MNETAIETTLDLASLGIEIDHEPGPKNPKFDTPEEIIKYASEKSGISIDQIMSKSRIAPVVEVKHIIMHYMCFYTELSLVSIGKIFGRDHSTVLHARDHIESLMKFDKSLVKRREYYLQKYL